MDPSDRWAEFIELAIEYLSTPTEVIDSYRPCEFIAVVSRRSRRKGRYRGGLGQEVEFEFLNDAGGLGHAGRTDENRLPELRAAKRGAWKLEINGVDVDPGATYCKERGPLDLSDARWRRLWECCRPG